MAVTLRLVRLGRKNKPFFRLRVSDSRSAATGRFIEELGYVDPIEPDESRQVVLKKERVEHWLSCGATASDTVRKLLKKQGIAAKSRA
ncbi:MAG: 30S ribosomal protein S16 [Planctomycetota bacterium]|nr:MAG: 30S ribosomal protein S16 [Planctomycetota bacterium]